MFRKLVGLAAQPMVAMVLAKVAEAASSAPITGF